jgi:hypothetical protein
MMRRGQFMMCDIATEIPLAMGAPTGILVGAFRGAKFVPAPQVFMGVFKKSGDL